MATWTPPITFACSYNDATSSVTLNVYTASSDRPDRYANLSVDEACDVAGAAFLHWLRLTTGPTPS